jgi:acyl-coenzyme A thioesterase PaaI-like protein
MSDDADNAENADIRREARRSALARLATSLRRLTDVAVCTDVPPAEIEEAAQALDGWTVRLAREQHDGPFSGLLPRQRDHTFPHRSMPLSPVLGELNPIRPEVQVELRDGRVRGSAVLSKKFIGPAHHAHGGVSAMICDQLLALAARARGLRGVTASLDVRFRRPVPLYEPLELEGWCEPQGAREARACCEIRARGEVAVRAEARVVLAAFAHPEQRTAAPLVVLEAPPPAPPAQRGATGPRR